MEDYRDRIAGKYVFYIRPGGLGPVERLEKKLREKGFVLWSKDKGLIIGCPWMFVNIETKVMAHGVGGCPVTNICIKHPISPEELFWLNDIYNNYGARKHCIPSPMGRLSLADETNVPRRGKVVPRRGTTKGLRERE